MNSNNYDLDLNTRQNLIKCNQDRMVTVAKLERVVDAQNQSIEDQHRFLSLFEQRYPLEFHNILLEFNLLP